MSKLGTNQNCSTSIWVCFVSIFSTGRSLSVSSSQKPKIGESELAFCQWPATTAENRQHVLATLVRLRQHSKVGQNQLTFSVDGQNYFRWVWPSLTRRHNVRLVKVSTRFFLFVFVCFFVFYSVVVVAVSPFLNQLGPLGLLLGRGPTRRRNFRLISSLLLLTYSSRQGKIH